jgi:hypothetical protein
VFLVSVGVGRQAFPVAGSFFRFAAHERQQNQRLPLRCRSSADEIRGAENLALGCVFQRFLQTTGHTSL